MEITVSLIRNRLCLPVDVVLGPGPAEPAIGFLLHVMGTWCRQQRQGGTAFSTASAPSCLGVNQGHLGGSGRHVLLPRE